MPLTTGLPRDFEARLGGLGEALAMASPDVEFAYLFGSAATGRARPAKSDVDVAIFLKPEADIVAARLDAIRVCTRYLATDAVDVVVLNTAPISLAGRVLTTRRVLLDRSPFLRHRFESLRLRMFHDFRIKEHRLLARRHGHG